MPRITSAEAAERAGIGASTFRGYVARGQAPAAAGFDPKTGLRVWDEAKVTAWIASRPGQGARTDRPANSLRD